MKQTTFEEFVDLARRATFVPVCKELVADLLQHIAPGIETKMLGGSLVAPFDPTHGIEQHDAIGRGLDRREKLLEPVFTRLQLLVTLAEQAPGAIDDFAPQARDRRRPAGVAHAQPRQHPLTAPQVEQDPYPARQHDAGGKAKDRAGHRQQPMAKQPPCRLEEEKAEEAPDHAQIVMARAVRPAAAARSSGNRHHVPSRP